MLLASAMGVMLCAAGAQGAFIGPLDFQGGSQVQYSDNNPSSGITVKLLSGSTTPADPFETTGNQSLLVEDASGTSNGSLTAKADWWNTSDPALTQGTFSGRFYTSGIGGVGTAYMSLRLGQNLGGTLDTVVFSFTVSDTSINFGGLTMDNTWAVGAPHNVALHFVYGVNNITVSGMLDGNNLISGTTKEFVISSPAKPSIDAFEILAGSTSNSNSRVIADDVTLAVPEPATAMLLGLGGFGMLMRRRRCEA
jgi:hypothetical protein